MTLLRPGNGTKRETAWTYRGRPLIIELHPRHMTLRLKGTHHRYPLHYESAWHRALEIEGRRRQVERLASLVLHMEERGKRRKEKRELRK